MLFDRLADQPGPAEAVASWTRYPGGAPANVACGLSKLGTAAALIGCLGNDEAGDELLGVLRAAAVATDGVQRFSEWPTRVVDVLRSPSGDRQFGGFGDPSPAGFADAHLQAGALPLSLFEGAEYLVLGTIPLAYPESEAALMRSLDLADQYYLKLLVDVNWRPSFWPEPEAAPAHIHRLLKRADFLKLSEEEAQLLFETTAPQDVLGQLEQLEAVFITLGDRGCAYATSQGVVGQLPGFIAAAIDTTGAGDSFVAGLVHQLVQQGLRSLETPESIEALLRYASAAGALTTMKPGAIAAQPTHAEIEAFLVGRVG